MSHPVYVVPVGGRWGVKFAGSERFRRIVDDRTEALKIGEAMAIRSSSDRIELRPDGSVRSKDSFRDPVALATPLADGTWLATTVTRAEERRIRRRLAQGIDARGNRFPDVTEGEA